ncbi:MAG: winged helix-turn-helix domain-containing protein, partial [Acidobacteria bacterium]|nr:winged helix-turn-helix domain-containing protein [Acidobacteriota bacterium]
MDESNGTGQQFMFADFCLDPAAGICTSGGREVHLAQRPFEVLVFLVANSDRVVSRSELLERFWDGHDVYDDALRKCVGAIRKALNDLERPGRFIETRYGGGYRFIADVGVVTKNGNGSASGNGTKPELRAVQGMSDADESDELPNASGYLRRVIIALLVFAGLGLALTFFVQNYQPWPLENAGENAGGHIRSIAVMPMKNLTGDAANEYFSDGITDSIISELSRVDGLRVISRTSTFALKGHDIDPVEVGQKLNVETFLEGSLKTKGDILNVDVRLISTRDGSVLWSSANFERPVAAAYELQDVVLCDLANRIREGACEGRATQNTVSSDAYQAYLKGRFQWNKRTAEGIRRSIEEYDRAIAFDPGYALPYAGLAESYVQGVWHVPFTAKDVLPKAEAAALKAISLNDNLAEAHTALASVYGLQWRWADADHELRRALEINPRYARAHHVQAFAFATLGQQEEA